MGTMLTREANWSRPALVGADRFVGKTGQMDVGATAQEAKHVKRANAIALIRRERRAMRQEQDRGLALTKALRSTLFQRARREGRAW